MRILVVGLVFVAELFMVCAVRAEEVLSEKIADALKTAQYIYVATRRMNGQWSTAAPVWFMYEDGKVYFTTSPSSHKAYRIRRGSPVQIWVGKKDGPFFEGQAELIRDPDLTNRMGEVYSQKYWIAWLGFFRPRPALVGSGKTLVVKVTPVAPLSEPGLDALIPVPESEQQ